MLVIEMLYIILGMRYPFNISIFWLGLSFVASKLFNHRCAAARTSEHLDPVWGSNFMPRYFSVSPGLIRSISSPLIFHLLLLLTLISLPQCSIRNPWVLLTFTFRLVLLQKLFMILRFVWTSFQLFPRIAISSAKASAAV
ncbi:hypothetical protein FKM82_025866 [Ascaphus truei]